ncbi:hypothetical protein BJY52DRAFT_1221184 [Lactarius psammicola]|nr:hypothetical protein BJY52DRAFT_1221184 [Lactarius psammicola]
MIWDDSSYRCSTSRHMTGIPLVTAHYPPAFLYEDPTKYNPDDVLQGFMRGYFLVRVHNTLCCRAIFIGPKSGLYGPSTMATPTRTGVAGIYGLLTITVPMIVYLATQAHFALSAQQTWTGKEHHFDYEEFFETLLQVFELDNDWCKETLSWWNEQIFGHTDGLAPLGPTQGETSDGILARAKIQVAMRHTAKSPANLAVVGRAAAEEQYREITPLIDPLEDKSSDNETAPPSRCRTALTVGAPDGGGDGSGEEHDRVGTQHSQKRSAQQWESSQGEGNDSANEGGVQTIRRSPQKKQVSKRQKLSSRQC